MPSELMSSGVRITKVLVCDPCPVVVAGVRGFLSAEPGLPVSTSDSLPVALAAIRENRPDVVLIDKAFGADAVADISAALSQSAVASAIVVWGTAICQAETVRMKQSGARGVLLKNASAEKLLACLRSVAAGRVWLEESMMTAARREKGANALTEREWEVYHLAEQGFTNNRIAEELRIKSGTVKIHMKHIFEKTGARGRHSIVLASMFGGSVGLAQSVAA